MNTRILVLDSGTCPYQVKKGYPDTNTEIVADGVTCTKCYEKVRAIIKIQQALACNSSPQSSLRW